jgi:hypothetical protein
MNKEHKMQKLPIAMAAALAFFAIGAVEKRGSKAAGRGRWWLRWLPSPPPQNLRPLRLLLLCIPPVQIPTPPVLLLSSVPVGLLGH